MKQPKEILKRQVLDFLEKASVTEDKTIRLSKPEIEAFKANFSQLCYDVRYGRLDEVFQELVNDEGHRNGVYEEQDLSNILTILDTIKAAE